MGFFCMQMHAEDEGCGVLVVINIMAAQFIYSLSLIPSAPIRMFHCVFLHCTSELPTILVH